MTTTTTERRDNPSQVADQPHARMGLALVRLTIGAMFVWVFFENLGKGLYTPSGYAGLIHDYIENSHAPAAWKSVMALAERHASMAAPLQGLTEISLGVLLVLGLFTRPVARQPMGFGVGNGVDMGAASSRPSLACVGRGGRGPHVGC
jgi:uncharacterized membrane protein YphA (DoxX/SURF4 family)